ncbi:transposase family protein, partial [[Kitasatospora] papulosa]|uniref:transposase family protein n=1 Tax=[Kitasatospora] papulosa TaxID=1464011 RepID=UPI0036CA950B
SGQSEQRTSRPASAVMPATPAVPLPASASHDHEPDITRLRRSLAARHHGIIRALANAGLKCWADKAYQGAGGPVRVPFRGRRIKLWKRRHNATHAKIRCVGEQATATLKGWCLLRKIRCSTNRITDVVKAVLVLHHTSA